MNNNHVSQKIQHVFSSMPEDIQEKIASHKYIQQVYDQFEQAVDSNLLKHVNSVYLVADKQALNTSSEEKYRQPKKLTIYVDNSMSAAEFNARRELIVLKYRELFNLKISVFEIKISKGKYKKQYPFIKKDAPQTTPVNTLTNKDYSEIEKMISKIKDQELKESFKKVLIAQKQRNKNIQKKQ